MYMLMSLVNKYPCICASELGKCAVQNKTLNGVICTVFFFFFFFTVQALLKTFLLGLSVCGRQPLAVLCSDHSVFSLLQPAIVLTRNELLYCSVLLSGILKPRVLQILCLAMVLSESQTLKVVGRILLRFLSAGIRKFSGGMAGMWPLTKLFCRVVSCCCFLKTWSNRMSCSSTICYQIFWLHLLFQ